jgi:hypothetical protein
MAMAMAMAKLQQIKLNIPQISGNKTGLNRHQARRRGFLESDRKLSYNPSVCANKLG